ncbi:hypothetical protein A2U01_0055598, partial [Trifolium medium]|nr:hypothetical protein [Trifolium medium]
VAGGPPCVCLALVPDLFSSSKGSHQFLGV